MLASSLRAALARGGDEGPLLLRLASSGLWRLATSSGGSGSCCSAGSAACGASRSAPLLRGRGQQQQARSLTSGADEQFIGHYTPVTKRLWAERLQWHTGDGSSSGDGGGGGPLEPRAAEVTEVTYPFTHDRGLVECYANPWHGIRIGRLLEDLDSLAGSVALRHCMVPGRPPAHLVTAGVDAIHLKRPLLLEKDLRLQGRVVEKDRPQQPRHPHGADAGEQSGLRRAAAGRGVECVGSSGVERVGSSVEGRSSSLDTRMELTQVNRVGCGALLPAGVLSALAAMVRGGRSSLDIRMELTQTGGPHPPDDPSLVAVFSFVSLAGGKASPVPPLAPATDQERAWFGERQAVADARKAQRAKAAAAGGKLQVPPSVQQHLDELVAAAAVVRDMPALASPHDMLMAATSLQNTFTCHFQQRNLHGRIFGGFLLRRAFELAFATCFTFAGARPVFDCIDDVQFKKPVDVGDLMRMKSCVLHAEGDKVVVLVEASVINPEARTSHPTNTFTFTFRAAPGRGQQRLRRVLPGEQGDLQRLRTHFAEAAL